MMIDFNKLEEEYLTPNIDDDDDMLALKQRIKSLDQADRNLMLLYIDLRSYRKVAKVLKNLSYTLVFLKIKEIKKQILL